MYRDSQLGLTIDLSGSDGNVFALMGYAKDLAKQIGVDGDTICRKMMESDYNHAVDVFESAFPVVTLLNKPDEQ